MKLLETKPKMKKTTFEQSAPPVINGWNFSGLKGRNTLSVARSTARRPMVRRGLALKGRNIIIMGQSLVKNYIHIVFSTKHRQPLIFPSIEGELYSYLGGICNNLDCTPIKIGGHYDHVHILCFLSKKIALMNLVEELKSHSSLWMKRKDIRLKNFYWQNGYGAFSVKASEVDIVKGYIENQHQHHARKIFQDEYRALLNEHETDYDERYVWD
jgi:putative transposase